MKRFLARQIMSRWGEQVYFLLKTNQINFDELDFLKVVADTDLVTTTPTNNPT